ncbi:hypothetical protein MFM001_29790 [Mycobacterium sp. MFM001]|uniref:DUF6390 family protein n=1 Tax=Mycobacterium sp. MFM001 TaxID=2049453 RepID=UPI000DA43BE0|nr:DUF6390 family protein [Mycobacterium sp. MFM001]GBE66517.1 hypothetical protein MFM001_29790 [Mycobacterium sp. MFM001]
MTVSVDTRGAEMFARYAYAPNALGFCGPPLGATLREGSAEEVRTAATKFSGAWPYLQVLSAMTGIADPLDYRLVESYWHGGGVGAEVDPKAFLDELLAVIGPQAGRYWSYLGPDLAREAAANHSFHVFGIYPWSRLLGLKGGSLDEHPLSVLDNCRITWGTVLSRDSETVEVSCRRLVWDGHGLELSEPSPRALDVWVDGYSAVPDVAVGDDVAIHWDRLCGRLQPEQIEALAVSTARQLRVTNRRLAQA